MVGIKRTSSFQKKKGAGLAGERYILLVRDILPVRDILLVREIFCWMMVELGRISLV